MTKRYLNTGWHWEYGWLRRPELDGQHGYCYEEPDGDLVFTPATRHRKACRLSAWDDNGERFLILSHVPTRTHRLAK